MLVFDHVFRVLPHLLFKFGDKIVEHLVLSNLFGALFDLLDDFFLLALLLRGLRLGILLHGGFFFLLFDPWWIGSFEFKLLGGHETLGGIVRAVLGVLVEVHHVFEALGTLILSELRWFLLILIFVVLRKDR